MSVPTFAIMKLVTNMNLPEYQSTNRQSGSSEHETHTGALVFLTLVALLVVGIAFAMAQPATDRGNSGRVLVQAENRTNQASSPKSTNASRDMSAVMQALPDTLPAPRLSQVTTASQAEDDSFAQNIVRFETQQPLANLYDQYHGWAKDSSLRVGKSTQNDSSASIVLAADGSQMFITMTDLSERRRVEINHVRR